MVASQKLRHIVPRRKRPEPKLVPSR